MPLLDMFLEVKFRWLQNTHTHAQHAHICTHARTQTETTCWL